MWKLQTFCDISKFSQISITFNNSEISLVVFMPNITTNHAITYTNLKILSYGGNLRIYRFRVRNPFGACDHGLIETPIIPANTVNTR